MELAVFVIFSESEKKEFSVGSRKSVE